MKWELFIIPLTMIFTEIIKRIWGEDKRWLPAVAVLIGGLLGALYGVYYGDDIMQFIVLGITYGATAAGIYDIGEMVFQKPVDGGNISDGSHTFDDKDQP